MKKAIFTLTALLFASMAVSSAQTMYDALDLGKDNYFGTARTLGMGNAVTAVGGDLGSVALNPAGSAVAGYSTFTISQGLSISSTKSSWAPAYSEFDGTQEFSGATKAGKVRYTMPNIGFNLRIDTGEYSGLKSWNFAFLSTMTNNFVEKSVARGFNAVGGTPFTSMAGAFATGAMFNSDGNGSMLDPDILTYTDPYNHLNRNGFYDRWQYITAYEGGMINYNETIETGGAFYGANEYKYGPYYLLDDDGNKIPILDDNGNPRQYDNGDPMYYQTYDFGVPGRLLQTSERVRYGSKNDIVTNFGFNFNDNFYVGVNFTFPIINLRYLERFSEVPDSSWPATATVTPEMVHPNGDYIVEAAQLFKQVSYAYNYDADISGINAGVGFIWLPVRNLRIGASIKTPTAYSVSERLYMTVDTRYQNLSRHGESPVGEFEYNFRSPWSMSTGLAWTFGSFGLVSADWQMTDFSVMKYSTDDDFGPDDPYARTNEYMNLFCGVSHSLRLGLELRPLPFLALRAGYTRTSNPERYYYDNEGYLVDASLYDKDYAYYQAGKAWLLDKKYYVNAPVSSVSLGVGYVSTGSFYADFALRRTTSASYYSPYNTYLEVKDDLGKVRCNADGVAYMVIAPCTRSVRSLVDAVLTVGWRF
ncbi:MAG: hypothetical protein K6F58_07675 [Bacteroidales bacterium]|nr:hypothetical protein [Bacteroidales bacterium]